MKKKKKSLIFISLGLLFAILFIVLPIYFFFFLDDSPDEYKKYDKGVTIEVNNLSNQSLPDLKFSYSSNQIEFLDFGTIKSLEPGKTGKISGSSKELKTSDISLYLHYYNEGGEKKKKI